MLPHGDEPVGGAARLDDIAARLLQLGASDVSELEAVREEFLEIARDADAPDAVRDVAAEALFRLDDLLFGKPSVPGEEILGQVIGLLEKAQNAESVPEAVAPGRAMPEPEIQLSASAPSEPDGRREASIDSTTPFAAELPPDADLDLLRDFVTESSELIEAAEVSLLALEVDPGDLESVNTVFRAFHTIKGTSGFLSLVAVKELAHRAESLLSRIRDGEIHYAGAYADLALRSVDVIKALIASLKKALAGEPMVKPPDYDRLYELLADPEKVEEINEAASEPVPRLGDLLVGQGKVRREDIEEIVEVTGGVRIGEALVKSGKATASDVAQGLRTQRKIGQPTGGEVTEDSSVRVRTDRLDRLIDMVGELVIAHSMVAQDDTVRDGKHQELGRKASQVGKIVRELQDLGMSLRMVPLKTTFQKMNRIVRDIAQARGKKIVLETRGEDTEIDRNMVDIIRDPLVHMVRNAADHGIETPEERIEAGKSEEGRITLSAYHAGGSVVVELTDDGHGLNKQKIVEKAISSGLIETAAGMSESDIFNLIFRPGFSTAEKVTDVSGRGVGMDVVRRNIEALRGRVEISSEWRKGSTFKMVLPLTMAITDGMLVQVGGERYIVPTVNIVKTFRPLPEQLSTISGKGEMVLLRGELLPLYRLHRLFDIENAGEDPTQGLLVIVASGESRYGMLVDELLGQQQVVAKSLSKGVGKVPGVSGAAILGDGRVGLILDSTELGALAKQEWMSGVASEVGFESAAGAVA